jgi:Cu(I)/Ag(I) efflux system membrane fusion protein
MAPGQSIRVRSTAFPDAPLVGVLGSLPVEVDPATRMAKLRAMVRIVHEEHHPLRPAINHASASAEIEVPGPEALTVPRSAVLDSGGGPLVYLVLASGRFLPRTVRLGRAGDTLWEVVGGLKAGDRVVTRGAVLVDAQARLHQGAGAMGAAQ